MILKKAAFCPSGIAGALLALIGCALLTPPHANATEATLEAGKPSLQRWTAADISGGADVPALAAGGDGCVFAANLDGVLRYDGLAWDFLSVPPQYLRALALDDEGRLWAGGVDCLGKITLREGASPLSESLWEKVPQGPALGVVRDIVAAGTTVWVASDTTLLRINGDQFSRWPLPQEGAGRLSVAGERLFFSQSKGPLWEFSGGKWTEALPAVERRGIELVFALERGGVAVFTAGVGVRDLAGRALAGFEGVSEILLRHPGASLVCGVRTHDGNFALGTEDAGLLWVSSEGGTWRLVTLAHGLPRNRVRSVSEDREGGLWVGTQDGLARVDQRNPGTLVERADGLTNTRISGLVRHAGVLYSLADDALLRLEPSPGRRDKPAQMVRDGRVTHEDHARQVVSSPHGLLLASDDGLRVVEEQGTRLVRGLEGVVGTVAVSRLEPDRLFLGREKGLSTAIWRDGDYRDEGYVASVEGEVVSLSEEPDGTLWASTTTRGLYRIQRKTTSESWAAASAVRYDQGPSAHGLPENHEQIFINESTLGPHFNTAAGLYRYLKAEDRFVFDERLVLAGQKDLVVDPVVGGAPGELWVNGIRTLKDTPFPLARLRQEADGRLTLQPLRADLRTQVGSRGFQAALWEPGEGRGVLWVKAFGGGFLRLDLNAYETPIRRPAPKLRHVLLDEKVVFLAGGETLPYPKKGFVIEAGPGSFSGGPFEYQSRMGSGDEAWSEWRHTPEFAPTGLEGGRYVYELKVRDAAGQVSEPLRVTFTMETPWRNQWWVKAALVLAGLALLWSLVRWRLAWLEKERQRLERVVAERTAQLREAKEAAESASQAKSRFLAQMSHELRTPLNGILGFTQVLQNDAEINARNQERLRIVGASGEHLLQMINEVLDFAKIEAGRMTLQISAFHLPQLVADLAAAARIRAEKKALRFMVHIEETLPEVVLGDAPKVRQVLENLLTNAVKFTSKGAVELEVCGAGDCRVVFRVKDSGVGLVEADLERIFEPFQQASEGRPPEPGTGLGLPISRRLVTLMGGTLSVQSAPGQGSVFEFQIPLEPTVQRPGEKAERRRITGYAGRRRRLLVVDDHAVNRRLLREMLEPLGFEIEEAEGGAQALALLGLEGPPKVPALLHEVMILDLRMPVVDGFAVLKKVREKPTSEIWQAPKILAMSASVLPLNQQEAAMAGCDDFLPKPFREPELLERLGRLLSLEWLHEDVESRPSVEKRLSGEVALSQEAIADLLRATERGDITEVKQLLERLRREQPETLAAVEKLEALAQGYQMARLRETLSEMSPRPAP